jgi:hypothetical protein
MGIDIYGWVEVAHVRSDSHRLWLGVISIRWLADRSYDIFAFLFGHGPVKLLSSLAGGRGLPHDISNEAADDAMRSSVISPSWIMWSELMMIVWQERNGSLTHITDTGAKLEHRITLTTGWSVLFEMMRLLAGEFGEGNVRLVVWFDSR